MVLLLSEAVLSISIFIPASVTSFGEGGDTHYEVAGNCPKLKEFIVATSNQTYCSKDGVLFSKDMKTLYRCPEGKSGRYAIPEGVRHIYDKLGDTSYGLAAFDRCKQLTEVAIPEGVKYLGWGLFTGCSGLKNLQFPVSLTCIYNNCFYDCGNIEKIYYSGTKKQWKEVTIYGGNEDLLKAKVYYRDEEPGSVIVSGGKYELNAKKTAAVFTGPENKNAKSLTIQKKVRIDGSDYHVTEIASDACSGMKKLSDLSIGIYVEKIGTNAFGGCWNLKKVKVLTAKLKKKNIGAGCFSEIYEKVVFSVPKKMLNQYKKWFIKIGEAPETSMFVK